MANARQARSPREISGQRFAKAATCSASPSPKGTTATPGNIAFNFCGDMIGLFWLSFTRTSHKFTALIEIDNNDETIAS
jgi:hypothetical protein